jgi:hypothetical protein
MSHVIYKYPQVCHISKTLQTWWKGCGGGEWQQVMGWEETEEIYEQLRGLHVEAWAQISMLFTAPSLGDVIVGGSEDNGLGLDLDIGIR